MKLNRLFWACMMTLSIIACNEPQSKTIQIVCTGDVHGNLFPYDFMTGYTVSGSLARVSSYIKEQRNKGRQVVYIDNGDILQGSPATYCYNTYAIGHKHVAAEALNYMGCNAVVLGNNEIETGGPTYQRYADDLNAIVLGGNILYEDSEMPFLPPYTIVEREGVQIAILGLTTPAIPHWIPQCQWLELEFDDMEHAASYWMKHLHENAAPDVVIGLFHSGYEGGIITDSYAENATRTVAERVPGFDAIFFGHDHRPRCSETVNVDGDTVLLLNPGKNAKRVATLDITLEKDGRVSLDAALVDMDGYAPDTEYMTALAPHAERIAKYLERKIGISDCEAHTRDALFGSSAYIDFVHQMQLDISGANISFAAPLIIDDMLPQGEVKVSDIYRLFPYENTLYVLWLTGREIKDYLELSYSKWTTQMTSPNDHLLLLNADKNSLQHPYCYFDSAAGIIYDVDVTKPVGQKVTIRNMADGSRFSFNERYMVAMNSFRAHGGGGLLTQGAGITHEELADRIEYTTTADLRFHMISYIEMRKTISPKPLNQWRFVPETWAVNAIQRDKALIE